MGGLPTKLITEEELMDKNIYHTQYENVISFNIFAKTFHQTQKIDDIFFDTVINE